MAAHKRHEEAEKSRQLRYERRLREEQEKLKKQMAEEQELTFKPKINANSRRIMRDQPVYDRLISEGLRKEKKMREMRAAKAVEEEANLPTFTPNTKRSNKSRSAASRSSSMAAAASKESGSGGNDGEGQEQEGGEGGHNRTASLHDRTTEWNKNRIIKRTKVMKEIVREKEKELTMHPKINKRSEMLAKKRRQQLRQGASGRQKSPVAARAGVVALADDGDDDEEKQPATIGEALYEDAEAAKGRLDKLREDTYRQEVPGYPAITRLAAEMIRDGPVSDRLYNHAKVQRRRRQEMAAAAQMEYRQKQAAIAMRGKEVRSLTKKHRTRAGRRGKKKELKQGESLYLRAVEQQQRKNMRKQAIDRATRESSVPAMNAHSRMLAMQLSKDPKERLYAGVKKTEGLEAMDVAKSKYHPGGERRSDLDDPELTFHPKVNHISRKIMAVKSGHGEGAEEEKTSNPATFERLYRDNGRNEEHLEKLRKEEVEEEMRECSFKPDIKSKFADSVVTNGKLEDRLHDWLHRRDAKRAQQQQEKANWVDDQCTFQPNITRKGAMAKAKVDSPRQRTRSPPATEADRARIQAKARAAREWAARAEQLAEGAGDGAILSAAGGGFRRSLHGRARGAAWRRACAPGFEFPCAVLLFAAVLCYALRTWN